MKRVFEAAHAKLDEYPDHLEVRELIDGQFHEELTLMGIGQTGLKTTLSRSLNEDGTKGTVTIATESTFGDTGYTHKEIIAEGENGEVTSVGLPIPRLTVLKRARLQARIKYSKPSGEPKQDDITIDNFFKTTMIDLPEGMIAVRELPEDDEV